MHKIRVVPILKVAFLTCLLLLWSLDLASQTYNWPVIIQQLEAAYSENPNDPEIIDSLSNSYNNYGLEFANNKSWVQAENYLQKARDINPNSEGIKKNLSNVYFAHGYELYEDRAKANYSSSSHDEAKQLANLALSIDPKNLNAYILLGDIEYINQNMRNAQLAWQKAAQLAPENEQVQQRLAKIVREAETENNMNEKYNAFFIIKIEPSLENIPNFDIAEVLDYARSNVSQDFNYKQNSKIPVIVYSATQYKDTLVEAPLWSQGAYDGKLRIIMSTNPKMFKQVRSTVVHEYTHAVIDAITHGNCPLWLNEGIAKYEESKYGVPPLINVLALAYNTNTIIDWNKINEEFRSPVKSEVLLAYQQAYSFVTYIVQKYGMSKLVLLLNTLSTNPDFPIAFNDTYGISLETAQQNWRSWLTGYIKTWAEAPVKMY